MNMKDTYCLAIKTLLWNYCVGIAMFSDIYICL